MGRQSNADRLAEVHSEAIEEFRDVQSACEPERRQALEDRLFYSTSGAQWAGALGDQFENKPRFEFNECHLAVIRIFSEYRNNRITVDFQTKDGSTDDTMADTCDGLYRADEKACSAEEAYDNAFEEGVGGGFGAWRVRACLEDEEDEDNDKQRVRFDPIHDADQCVFFDLNAKRQDKSDAKRCWVLTPYTRKAYEAEWDDDVSDWPQEIQSNWGFDWVTPDVVWVAEFYRVEEDPEVVRYFQGLDAEAEPLKVTDTELEADPQMLDELQATGFRELEDRKKTVKRRKVHKYLMSGGKVLEDCGFIAGKHIPIVPFYGKRWVVSGVERFMGHVRLAKDAQRLQNMLMSWLAEMAARFDMQKPIFSPEQIGRHAGMWARDNVEKFPYLLSDMVKDGNGFPVPGSNAPSSYTQPPQIPPAMAALAQMAKQSLQDLLGNQQAGEQIQPNLSGKAVELIQNRLDMQVFIYLSNLGKSMKRCGEIWLSQMRDICVEKGRRMKTISGQGESSSVVVNQPAYDAEEAREYIENDMTAATFDVDVSVGPSSNSLRQAVVRSLTGIATITEDPETKQALTLATIANIEGEGLSDLREWARSRAIRMGLVKPTDEEKAELAQEQANRQPDPQAEYLRKAAMAEEAKAGEARANTVRTVADAELKQAQTQKTIGETVAAYREASQPQQPQQPPSQ